jgi:hypothetical protein
MATALMAGKGDPALLEVSRIVRSRITVAMAIAMTAISTRPVRHFTGRVKEYVHVIVQYVQTS